MGRSEQPLVRLAFLACQLISPKRNQEGNGNAVSAGDLTAFLGGCGGTLEKDAALLLEWVEQLEHNKYISGKDGNKVFFKFVTRCVLFHLKRSSVGYEQRAYQSIQEIKGTAAADVKRLVPVQRQNPCTWTISVDEPTQESHTAPMPVAAVGAATVQNSATMLLKSRDLTVGDCVFDKRVGYYSIRSYFAIASVSDVTRKVMLKKLEIGGLVPPFQANIDLHELIKHFTKAKFVPEAVTGAVAEEKRVNVLSVDNIVGVEVVKAWHAMMEYAQGHEDCGGRFKVVHGKWGSRLYAARNFAAGELVLVPRCNLKDLTVANALPATDMWWWYVHWSCGGVMERALTEQDGICFTFSRNKDHLEPFNIVRSTSDCSPNLRLERRAVGALTVPILTNDAPVMALTELTVGRASVVAVESLEQRRKREKVADVRKAAERGADKAERGRANARAAMATEAPTGAVASEAVPTAAAEATTQVVAPATGPAVAPATAPAEIETPSDVTAEVAAPKTAPNAEPTAARTTVQKAPPKTVPNAEPKAAPKAEPKATVPKAKPTATSKAEPKAAPTAAAGAAPKSVPKVEPTAAARGVAAGRKRAAAQPAKAKSEASEKKRRA
jgi:hypothetical protein